MPMVCHPEGITRLTSGRAVLNLNLFLCFPRVPWLPLKLWLPDTALFYHPATVLFRMSSASLLIAAVTPISRSSSAPV